MSGSPETDRSPEEAPSGPLDDSSESRTEREERAESSGDGWRSRRWWARRGWFWAALLLLGVVQVSIFHRTRHDDAFISYRYAENLDRGRGMVFNPGERVLASTAPGHVLLATVVHRVAGHEALPSVMSGIGTLAWMAQAAAVFLLLGPVVGEAAAGVVALLIALGLAGSGRWVALETNLVVALELWAVVAVLRSRTVVAGLLAGLAALVRPDALLFAGLLLLWIAVRHRRRAVGSTLATAAVLAPWVLFASLYFGSPLPQSATTKFQVVDLASYLRHSVTLPASTLFSGEGGWVAVAAAWLLAVAGAVVVVRRRPELWILPAFYVAHAAAYLYLRPYLPHVWHLYPTTLLFVVFALAALGAALADSRRALRAGAAVVLFGLAAPVAWAMRGAPGSLESDYFRGRHEAYTRIAEVLRQRARPGDSVIAVEVGTIAYLTDLPMTDLGLLVSPRERAQQQLGRSRFVLYDRIYTQWFEPQFSDVPRLVARVGEFEAYLFDLEDPFGPPG